MIGAAHRPHELAGQMGLTLATHAAAAAHPVVRVGSSSSCCRCSSSGIVRRREETVDVGRAIWLRRGRAPVWPGAGHGEERQSKRERCGIDVVVVVISVVVVVHRASMIVHMCVCGCLWVVDDREGEMMFVVVCLSWVDVISTVDGSLNFSTTKVGGKILDSPSLTLS